MFTLVATKGKFVRFKKEVKSPEMKFGFSKAEYKLPAMYIQ